MNGEWNPDMRVAPRDGTHILAKGPRERTGRTVVRRTWWGKTSHVPLYGWCWNRHPNDPESVDLWQPDEWKPRTLPPAPETAEAGE